MKAFCDDETYRQKITELAASVFDLKQFNPGLEAEAAEIIKYRKVVSAAEELITERAAELSNEFNVPIDIVHSDIKECSNFLPEDDLKQTLELRKRNLLH